MVNALVCHSCHVVESDPGPHWPLPPHRPVVLLRSDRPGYSAALPPEQEAELKDLIKKSEDGCDFCNYEERTAADVWGRIESKLCYTASNVAKYQGYHTLVVARQHSPLDISLELVSALVHRVPSAEAR